MSSGSRSRLPHLNGYCPVSRAALLGVHTGRVYRWGRRRAEGGREAREGIRDLGDRVS